MSDQVYISRYFVEFGPLKLAEILDYQSRGLIHDKDYLRYASSEAWTPAEIWLGDVGAPKTSAPAAKAPAKKKAPTKKAS